MNFDKFIKEGWNSFEFAPVNESIGTFFEICEEEGEVIIYKVVFGSFNLPSKKYLRNISDKKDTDNYHLISKFSEPGEFYPADRQWRYLSKNKYMAFL